MMLIGIDVAVFALVYAFSIFLEYLTYKGLRLELIFKNIDVYAINFLLFFALIFATRLIAKIYKNVWRYANSKAYLELVFSDAIGGGLALLISRLFPSYALGGWFCIASVAMFNCASLSIRFAYQQYYKINARSHAEFKDSKISVAIVGAGQVGALLADELMNYKGSYYRPVCFIDNDPEKKGSRIAGLPVYGEDDDVLEKLKVFPVQEIFIAIPQLDGDEAQKILEHYARSGCKVKLYDFPRNASGDPTDTDKRVLREFKIEDLLFRNSKTVTDDSTRLFYKDKVVLITGGGGSIGSELARQVAKCAPKQLIIFDIYENNAYDVQQELLQRYGDTLNLAVEIGSVRDVARLDAVFTEYRPNIVFHAAAHKHVPLMEHSNCEAIKNNCLGTYNTANAAEKYGVEKFILISTDKAVNPTNVMGASKRMCEMIIQCRLDSKTAFSAVRFGNVLGSNGSVIPLFKKQIAKGGPITITDKRIIRYFMTIPEAAGLVMQAGAKAVRGELFVLDMGKPIKIYDLAMNMIKLSGLVPFTDIDIKEIGLRPGEKLYEELLIKTENLTKTDNDMIFIEQDTPYTRDEIEQKLKVLKDAVRENETKVSSENITAAMKQVIPTFHSPDEVNEAVNESDEMRVANGS
ncbi:MAG: polysaccharide biosynthesis protein [Clostridia bacterium]|nr:polysaccharide biosynthesis protein [Clostridia bacterium]